MQSQHKHIHIREPLTSVIAPVYTECLHGRIGTFEILVVSILINMIDGLYCFVGDLRERLLLTIS